jgi:stage III sporulation protein AA
MDKTKDVLNQILSILPDRISYRINKLPDEIKNEIQEFRIRADKPLIISCGKLSYYITDKSFTADMYNNLNYITLSKSDVFEIFTRACAYSVYNRQNEITKGFITLNGGHRMGIAGTPVYSNGEIINIKEIYSLNIRVSKEYIGCSKYLFGELQNNINNLLICGKPCSGKTTLIRDLARALSIDFNKKVCVIDSRNEISATYKGVPTNDLGMCDVFSLYKKIHGIENAIRNMSPDYVVCDEIVNEDEVKAISQGLNSGVKFIATMHCSSVKELYNKPMFKKLYALNGFEKAVVLKNHNHPCEIDTIVDMKELKNKNDN